MVSVLPSSQTFYIDISLHSVSVALVEKNALSKHHTVLATRSAHFPDSRHFHKTLVAIRVRAQEILELLKREYSIRHYSLVFTVHAPLCSSRALQHTYAFKDDTQITKAHIQEVLESAQKAHAEKNSVGVSSVFREYLTGVALNGYHTDTPLGKTAREVTCTIIQESLAGGVMKAVIEPLARDVAHYDIYNYAQLVGLMLGRTETSAGDTFALCEIAPESVEISLYAKRQMTHQMTLPVGSRTILEKVRTREHVTHEFIEGQLSLYAQSATTDDVKTALEKLIEDSADVLKQVLKEQPEGINMFPPRMFLITDKNHEHFWVTVLSKALQNPSLVPEKIVFDTTRISYTSVHDMHILLAVYGHITDDTKATALPM